MAERGYTPVNVVPVFLKRSLSAGDAGTSDPIDLREIAQRGFFSLAVTIAAGTSTTCGTTVFSYAGASTERGVFSVPSSSIGIGTAGTSGTANIMTFEPEPMPFMKIIATQTGAANAGANSRITAELIVQ